MLQNLNTFHQFHDETWIYTSSSSNYEAVMFGFKIFEFDVNKMCFYNSNIIQLMV